MLHTDPGFPLVVVQDVTIGHHAILHGYAKSAKARSSEWAQPYSMALALGRVVWWVPVR
jgi:predicted deacetylase